MLALIELSTPKGAPREFLLVFAVLLLGPILFRRAGIPGIIGLLVGGYAIGPHGLSLIGAGNNTLPDLGQLGLLYLMFVAGVELDLNLISKYRRSTISFGILTFAIPFVLGTVVGLALGWETLAAILLGSLLASHTLITYPAVKDAGLASDPAVATAVGSTVLTDTLALIVLAAVAGSVAGGRSSVEVAAQVGVGLIVLVGYSLFVLPQMAGWAFRWLGTERAVRYVVAITAFLSAATVAELFGIEGIVGAFFAGLGMNRLVPNEGQLMDRIEFFGGAVFIPVFLVSVGLILDPSVMVKSETLGLAGLFILACLGGKVLAAQITARLFGFSRAQAGLLFSLSAAQAAATLAATVIGFQLGLFSSAVVNAVLVLIFASVLASTIAGARASARMSSPDGPRPLGTRVVVGVADPALALGALTLARRIARADGGVVHPLLVVPESAPFAPRPALAELSEVVAAAGVDGRVLTIVDRSVLHGALRVGRSQEATLVLVAEPAADDDSQQAPAALAAGARERAEERSPAPPVAVVRGNAGRLGVVRMRLDNEELQSSSLATEMARRVASGPAERLDEDHADWSELLAPGDVTFVSSELADTLGKLPGAANGLVVSTVAEWLIREESAGDAAPELPGDATAV
ncbi:MAG TPA: cation:proton antiporter [Solirubrobacteraceae bacterium]|jgi:Kef-type K+ transport system membrane component KefB|nr:cation:proton antiporter [Solirubrobacteraceae bacterium]